MHPPKQKRGHHRSSAPAACQDPDAQAVSPPGEFSTGTSGDYSAGTHTKAPAQITLDLDATDDPLHGQQEGRFFHGYYDCYCYLPLYIFCGRHLLAATLRRSNIDGAAGAVEEVPPLVTEIRRRWPRARI